MATLCTAFSGHEPTKASSHTTLPAALKVGTVEAAAVKAPVSKKEPVSSPASAPAAPAPVQAPAVATAPAPARTACDYINDYDWDRHTMHAIAMAESGCIPQTGDTRLTFTANGRTYGYSLGVLQVRILQGREQCDTEDPAVIMQCAYNVYKGQGFAAWSMYNNGRYAKFL